MVGLAVGCVVAGGELIRKAQLNAIGSDANRFIEATQTFRQKYAALPGDMKNATQFWGVLAGTGSDASCAKAAATGTATCNGDGNGRVSFTRSGDQESLRFWQHLANAGLISGQYTGIGAQPIVDAHSTSGHDVTWLTGYMGNHRASDLEFAGAWGNVFSVLLANDSALRPVEAYRIDAKFDDGMPATGKIIGFKGSGAHPCINAAKGDDARATYNVGDKLRDCPMLYFVRAY